MKYLFALFALSCVLHFAECLSVKISLPDHAITNSIAHLDCVFDLQDNRLELDSVKVHKDNKVFYVYSPAKQPVGQRYSVPGVDANDVEVAELIGAHSGEIRVRLLRVNLMSSGKYGCEVRTKDAVNTYGYPIYKEMIVRDSGRNAANEKVKRDAATLIACVIVLLLQVTRNAHQ